MTARAIPPSAYPVHVICYFVRDGGGLGSPCPALVFAVEEGRRITPVLVLARGEGGTPVLVLAGKGKEGTPVLAPYWDTTPPVEYLGPEAG